MQRVRERLPAPPAAAGESRCPPGPRACAAAAGSRSRPSASRRGSRRSSARTASAPSPSPSARDATAFWTERTKTCIIIPSPIPAIDHVARRLAVRRVDVHPPEQQHRRSRARPGRRARSAGSDRSARPSGPEIALAMTAPSISGVSTTPDEVAEVPITPCTKSGTKLIVPNIAMPTSAMQAMLEATIWFRSRSNGRIGSAHTPLDEREEREQAPQTPRARRAPAPSPTRTRARPRRARAGAAAVPAASSAAPSQSIECSLPRRPLRHRHQDHGERDDADRQVDEEDPAPGRVVDDEAADRGPDDRRGREDRADQPLVAPAVARRDDHRRPSRARAGRGRRRRRPGWRGRSTSCDHALRQAAERGADEEDRDRDDEERPPAVRRRRASRRAARSPSREHVRGEDPRVLADPAEVARRSAAARSRRSSGRAPRAAARPSAPSRSRGRGRSSSGSPAACERAVRAARSLDRSRGRRRRAHAPRRPRDEDPARDRDAADDLEPR